MFKYQGNSLVSKKNKKQLTLNFQQIQSAAGTCYFYGSPFIMGHVYHFDTYHICNCSVAGTSLNG